MQYLCRFALSLFLFHILAGTTFAASQEEVKSATESRYKLTVPGFLGGFKEVGSVLVVQKEGLRANRPSKTFKPNIIENRRVTSAGGGDLPLGGKIDPDLKTGDRLYLYDIRTGNDYVQLDLFTVNTFVIPGSGTKGPTPLQASVRFRYEGGLAAITSAQILEDVGAWFKAKGEARDIETGQTVAPPATRTIQLGQTEEEVVAIMGPPEKKVMLGAKTIYVYRDLKVVFIDGKVADAE